MDADLEPYLDAIQDGMRKPQEIRKDIFDGKCTPIRDERGKLVGAQYPNGVRFDLIDYKFYTFESFVLTILVGYHMSSGNGKLPELKGYKTRKTRDKQVDTK